MKRVGRSLYAFFSADLILRSVGLDDVEAVQRRQTWKAAEELLATRFHAEQILQAALDPPRTA